MRPLTISLIGLPGAGKTTLCRSLAKHFGWRSFVLGDALRARAAKDTALKAMLDRGELAPENVAIELVQETVREAAGQGLVLDGFPRHIEQIDLSLKLFHSWIVLYLEVDISTATNRLTDRVSCATCGWVGTVAQEASGCCPNCGEKKLQTRPEDDPEILASRMKQASSRLDQLLQSLDDIRLIRLDATRPIDQVLESGIAHLAQAASH